MNADQRKLLRMIAALPAGERLPVSRFARALDYTASVVVGMVERLIDEGEVDGESLRPPPRADAPGARPSADSLYRRVVAEAERRGVSKVSTSIAVFGHPSSLNIMKGRHGAATTKTIDRVERWLAGATEPPGAGAAVAEEGGAARELAPPSEPIAETPLPRPGDDSLASPSALLRRAQQDWPDQCERVRGVAAEIGVSLGEAWRRVIAAGVDCLSDPEAA